MIMADKIIALRKKAGWSQEELAEKLAVSRQSVSKWESGLSVPDLNKIIAMSELFGVSTDYLVKDRMEEVSRSETAAQDDMPAHTVSVEEANRFLDLVGENATRVAIGVALCILSPILLILLAGGAVNILPQTAGIAVGLVVLLLLVGVAVALFVPAGMKEEEYEYMEREALSLGYGVEGIVDKHRAAYAGRYRLRLTFGILLCVFSVLPLVCAGAMEAKEPVLLWCLSGLLALCACGVFLIVQSAYRYGGYEKLLQKGEYSEENKRRNQNVETVSTAYWCVVTALYLAVSFLTSAWHITWVVWPVAACLWPVIPALLGDRKK